MDIENYIHDFKDVFDHTVHMQPWEFINHLERLIVERIKTLNTDYYIENNIAIHKTAVVEQGVILKGAIIISEDCFIGAHAYFRESVYLGKSVKVGPSSEIKQSMLFDHTSIAHFNYIGNSIIGAHVNFEAGSICANHYNERDDKTIYISHHGERINTHSHKFGSLVGDYSKIGANAVLSPGTILEKNSIVKRLELIEQT